jgi:hypothetical protein
MNNPERLELIREHAIIIKREAMKMGIASIAFDADTIQTLANSSLEFLEANRGNLKQYGERFGLALSGNRRVCPQCGTSYGSGDLSCPGCGHCFICSRHHWIVAEPQLEKFIQPNCDMPGDGYP